MAESIQTFTPSPAPFSAEIPQGRIGSSTAPSGPGGAISTLGVLEETTLDEPVSQTILRDVRMVWDKLKKVVFPTSDTRDELRNWDLWGPLFLCLTLAILLSIDESGPNVEVESDRTAIVFSALLIIVWVGAIVVTVNAKLLGGNVSFFQNICLLGYCVAPMIASTAACMTIHLLLPDLTFTCGPGPHTVCENNGAGPCIDTMNTTINVGASCNGWKDKTSCIGDGICNVTHTSIINVFLRLLFSLGGMVWSLRSSLGFLAEVVKPERRALAAYPVCLFFGCIAWMVMIRTSSS